MSALITTVTFPRDLCIRIRRQNRRRWSVRRQVLEAVEAWAEMVERGRRQVQDALSAEDLDALVLAVRPRPTVIEAASAGSAVWADLLSAEIEDDPSGISEIFAVTGSSLHRVLDALQSLPVPGQVFLAYALREIESGDLSADVLRRRF